MMISRRRFLLFASITISGSLTSPAFSEDQAPVALEKTEGLVAYREAKDIKDKDGEVNGFEFSGVVSVGDKLIVVDNETRKISGKIDGVDDVGAQALFEASVTSGKITLQRAWPGMFSGLKKADYDDIEGLAVRRNTEAGAAAIYLLGSHSPNKKNEERKERHVLIRLKVDAKGNAVSASPAEPNPAIYRRLTTALRTALKASLEKGGGQAIEAKLTEMNLEGLAVHPKTGTLLLGLRQPLVGEEALVLELHDADSLFDNPQAQPRVTEFARLNLGGRGIAALDEDTRNETFLVAAAPRQEKDVTEDSSLWRWQPRATAPGLTRLMQFPGHKLEGVTRIGAGGPLAGHLVLVFDEESGEEQFGRIMIINDRQRTP